MNTNQTSKRNFRDPKPLQRVLKHRTLARIIGKAKLLLAIEQKLNLLLGDRVAASHCQVMDLNETRLTLKLNSAAWATPLQYAQADILQRLHKQFPKLRHITEVKFKVRPHSD